MKPIFLIGYMGAGKTTLARQLSALYGIPYIDLDQEIEKIIGISISDYFISSGESNFRMLEYQTLLNIACRQDIIISTGGGTPCFFDNMDIMNVSGTTVYLKRDVDYLYDILVDDKSRPLICNLNKEEIKTFIIDTLNFRERYYNQSKIIIDSKDFSAKNIKCIIDKELL